MVRRRRVELEDVAALENLSAAFWRAALGKRHREEVRRFEARLDANLARLGAQIRSQTLQVGRSSTFRIHDPKPRTIHAPCFVERVLHHALMAQVGPVLDRALVFDTYACREGKGALAAATRAQAHLRKYPWYVKADVRAYFASIPHARLLHALARRLKGDDVLALVARILEAHHTEPGRGLPIGALTSQHFANYYLSSLDRLLLERLRVAGMVRYQGA